MSIPTPILLRAWLLMALYSTQSERALCEQVTMNAGFRWFVGVDWDDKVFDHSTLSKNRERPFRHRRGRGSAWRSGSDRAVAPVTLERPA